MSRAYTGKSCWIMSGQCMSSIVNIRAMDSLASTSMWNHNNARRTRPREPCIPGGSLETYREVRALAKQNRMTVNADIPNKFLKGDLAQREALMSSLPRLKQMLYELSNPSDGSSSIAQADKLRQAGENYFDMAYQGLSATALARMAIGLRTPDYESQLPNMLKTIEDDMSGNPHYLGWAWHSYNDAK
jgi:hypothetical protein